jgi:hypothetical protein
MSLESLKRRINVDQRNILIGTVIDGRQNTVRVRTARGEIREAAKPACASYSHGQRLELRTDGRTITGQGVASLAELGGEVVFVV